MDPWIVTAVALAVAAASLIAGISAILATRSALSRATAAALANRSVVEKARAETQAARQEAAMAVSRLAEVETRLLHSDGELRTALQRTALLEQELGSVQRRLKKLAEGVPPPPIPTGRTASRLEDLRATLRAQAAEAEAEVDTQ